MNQVLSKKWSELRGVEVASLGIFSVKASEENEAMVKELPLVRSHHHAGRQRLLRILRLLRQRIKNGWRRVLLRDSDSAG